MGQRRSLRAQVRHAQAWPQGTNAI